MKATKMAAAMMMALALWMGGAGEAQACTPTPAPILLPTVGVGPTDPVPCRDWNTSSAEDLDSLPGVGPVMLAKLLAARPFHSWEDVDAVPGVGPATLAKWQALGCWTFTIPVHPAN